MKNREKFLQQSSFLNVKLAPGRNVKVLGQFDVKFKTNEHKFEVTFLILLSKNSVVVCNPFFPKNSIESSQSEKLIELPELTCEMNERKTPCDGRQTTL